ncbi:P2R1A-PPP2R2A-interacting phosphatase regulator 1-like isoform X2 [Corticium candelabrum]|uniref:P2R1A-PPP2R2A-interacting phosphatase regulator 1-like isoform X2 n=1 Tax=Corticium candelabrum TaxID=121492 RepID=UPI002E25BECE|nr:P2R1A-PPP2R2A-interacting phosphatase regulator 1-like isoform X2 [Corticium candelabrum]
MASDGTAMETDEPPHFPFSGALKRSTSAPMIVEAVNAASSSARFPSIAALDLAPPCSSRRRAATFSGSSLPASPSLAREPRVYEIRREESVDDCLRREIDREKDVTSTLHLSEFCHGMHLDEDGDLSSPALPTTPRLVLHAQSRKVVSPTSSLVGSSRKISTGMRRRSHSPVLRPSSLHRPSSLNLKRKRASMEGFSSPPKRNCNVPSPLLLSGHDFAFSSHVTSDSDSGRGASPRNLSLNGCNQSPDVYGLATSGDEAPVVPFRHFASAHALLAQQVDPSRSTNQSVFDNGGAADISQNPFLLSQIGFRFTPQMDT